MLRYNNLPNDIPIIALPATSTTDGLMAYTDKLKLNDIVYSDNTLNLSNMNTGGVIGTNVDTVDKYKNISINQTTSNQVISLPIPTEIGTITSIIFSNVGTASLNIYNIILNSNNSVLLIWNTNNWEVLTSYNNINTYNIIEAASDILITSWNTLVLINTIDSSSSINIYLPTSNDTTQSKTIIISNISGNANIISNQNIFPANTTFINNIFTNLKQSILITSLLSASVITSSYSQTSSLNSAIRYLGDWDAMNNIPLIQNAIGNSGDYYHVSVGGNSNIDNINNWNIGDWIIFNGTSWDKITNSLINLIPAKTWKGNNTSITNNINDNMIHNINESNSSVLNISSSYSVLNPVTIEVKKSNNIMDGYLSSSDWNTFNNKQSLIGNAISNNFVQTNSNGQVIDSGISYSDTFVNTPNTILSAIAVNNLVNKCLMHLVKPLGIWNATENKPFLSEGRGVLYTIYYVSVAGSQSILSGTLVSYNVGEYIYYDKATMKWLKK